MTRHRTTDRFNLLTRRIALLAFACILLPTLILVGLVLEISISSQRFSTKLANEFIPYGLALVDDRVEERYRSECLALLESFHNKEGGSLSQMDISFVFRENLGISRTIFQYSRTAGLLSSLPANAFRGPDTIFLRSKLSALLTPELIDNRLHFLNFDPSGNTAALPFIYSYDQKHDTWSILGFIPDAEYIEKEIFPNLLHTDIFSSQDIFQGEVLEKYFAFVILRGDTPVASTDLKYAAQELASKPIQDILPGYRIGVHYLDEKLQVLEGFPQPTIWGLIVLLIAVFAIGLYSFLKLTLKEFRLSQAKSTFISNVSHELKTPLGLIRLFNETLDMKRYRDEDERHGFHETITRETVRLTNMINRLLSFSRMESGGREYSFQPADLGEVVSKVLEDYGRQLADAGFEIERDINHTIEPLPLDRESISQAVINLLDNAQKYSGDRKWIKVTAGESDRGPFIEVADKGIGVSREDMDHIFEMFFRVEQGLRHDVKGLGIGLAVVRKITEDHGGRVEVESKPGEGSTFRLVFDRAFTGGEGDKTRRT